MMQLSAYISTVQLLRIVYYPLSLSSRMLLTYALQISLVPRTEMELSQASQQANKSSTKRADTNRPQRVTPSCSNSPFAKRHSIRIYVGHENYEIH